MEVIRQISDTAVLQEQGWREAAQEMLTWEWDLDSEIALHGTALADHVVQGRLMVSELRAGVAWANAHDHEATMCLQGLDAVHQDDRIEATARRLAHSAGRWALQRVKTAERKFAYQLMYRHRVTDLQKSQQLGGMFCLEAKDNKEDIVRLKI